LILLAVAGTLPELAITISAAASGHLGLAAGNLIGGIAIQTMVLVLCDAAASRTTALTYLAGSLTAVLEGLLVVFVVAEALGGALLPVSDAIGSVSPASIAIVVTWLAGIVVIKRVKDRPAWSCEMPGSAPGRPHRRVKHPAEPQKPAAASAHRAIIVFVIASAVTLGAGVVLEVAGNDLADRAGINGVIFGATVLATATALPEISSGLAAVKLGDNALAIADIFGGNAFQVCLFLVADLVAGTPVLPSSGKANGWLATVGIVVTVVYSFGVIVRLKRAYIRLGVDSLLVVGIFALGILGLYAIQHP
jgi:cation:H+ antiporter